MRSVEGSAPNAGEIRARFQTERLLQTKLTDYGIHGCLAVLALDLAQQQTHGITIVTASEAQLLGNDLARTFQRHFRTPCLQKGA